MPLRYEPLARFLAAQSPETEAVTLSLAEIEELLGGPLPRSAWGRSFWANKTFTAQGQAWLGAGWRVARVRLRTAAPWVTFRRCGDAPGGAHDGGETL